MNILVLGGNGYLGSKLIGRFYAEKKHRVIFTRRQNSDLSRVNAFINGDGMVSSILSDFSSIVKCIEDNKIDLIINAANCYCRENDEYDTIIETNINFPLRVLNYVAKKEGVRYLTFGTALPDEFNIYSFSKKTLANFGKFYSLNDGIDFYNVKLQMFYGADEPGGRFVSSTIKKMINGEEINTTIGTQKRDIIHIDDVVDAILMVINSDLHGYCEIPVGTGTAPTISELVDYIWESTGKKSKVNKGTVPMRANEPDCVADTSILKALGEWSPLDWKSGVQKVIEEMKESKGL